MPGLGTPLRKVQNNGTFDTEDDQETGTLVLSRKIEGAGYIQL